MKHLQIVLLFALFSVACHAQGTAPPANGGFGVQLEFLENDAAPGHVQFWAVMAVAPGSPAASAGIQAGDKIVYVNGQVADKLSQASLQFMDSADFLIFRASNNTFFKVMGLRKSSDFSFAPPGNQDAQQQFIDAYVATERGRTALATAQPSSVPSPGENQNNQASLQNSLNSYFSGQNPPNSVAAAPAPDSMQSASATPAKKPGFWSNLATALANQPGGAADTFGGGGGGGIAGSWQGGKSEHDYAHGGYVNADWSFTFGADGTYDETVFVGGQQAMHAAGTYSFAPASKSGDRTVTNLLTFNPASCEYTSRELAQVVAPFPLPTNARVQEYVNFFRVSDGNTMMLQNASRNGAESWQMKAR